MLFGLTSLFPAKGDTTHLLNANCTNPVLAMADFQSSDVVLARRPGNDSHVWLPAVLQGSPRGDNTVDVRFVGGLPRGVVKGLEVGTDVVAFAASAAVAFNDRKVHNAYKKAMAMNVRSPVVKIRDVEDKEGNDGEEEEDEGVLGDSKWKNDFLDSLESDEEEEEDKENSKKSTGLKFKAQVRVPLQELETGKLHKPPMKKKSLSTPTPYVKPVREELSEYERIRKKNIEVITATMREDTDCRQKSWREMLFALC